MYDFEMPSLGASMDEGRLVEWKIDVGDRVERGDVVCDIETQKGVIEVEIWQSGEVAEILVEPGEKVPVGEPLARLRTAEEVEPAEEPAEPEPAAERDEPEAPADAESELAAKRERPEASRVEATEADGEERGAAAEPVERRAGEESRRRASPAARRRASELGVDLSEIEGTGPDGAVGLRDVEAAAAAGEREEHRPRVSPLARRIAEEEGIDLSEIEGSGERGAVLRRDVERAAGRTPGAGAEAEEDESEATGRERAGTTEESRTGMREAIARAMETSKREIPHYYLRETVDMKAALDWIEEQNAERGPAERLLPSVLLLKAVALAAEEVPATNGYYRDGSFEPSSPVHVGFAVSLHDGGVVTPALHDVDHKDLDTLMGDLRDLVRRVRRGRLRSSEMTDATITVTSLGERGVESVYGVIYPPQVAIVGFGKIVERPWAVDGMLDVRPLTTATFSGDHRVTDGETGGRFLSTVSELLQHPEML